MPPTPAATPPRSTCDAALVSLAEHPLAERLPETLRDAALVVVTDATDSSIVGTELLPGQDPTLVAACVMALLLAHEVDDARIPGITLRVRDAHLLDALRAYIVTASLEDAPMPRIELADSLATVDAAADRMLLMLASRHELRSAPLTDDSATAYFFRAAVTVFNAKPWRTLGDPDVLEVTFANRRPLHVAVHGNDTNGTPNVSVTVRRAIAPGPMLAGAPASTVPTLGLAFGTDVDAPTAWRDLRRARKWPLASPQAFPMPFVTDLAGASRMPTPDELRELATCLNVVAATIATRRKDMDIGAFREHDLTVRDDQNTAWHAHVQFAGDDGDDDASAPPIDERITPVLDIRDAALALPDIEPLLARLAWTFFLGDGPGHARNEDDEIEADARFVDWALFAYRGAGETLAARAVTSLAATRSADDLAALRRALVVHAGVFRIESTEAGEGMTLRDVERDTTFRMADRHAADAFKLGDYIAGMLHELGDGLHGLAVGATLLDEEFTETASRTASIERFGPTFEQQFFGATSYWIDTLHDGALEQVYSVFRDALAATGATLPTYVELERQVALADQPQDVAKALIASVTWWSDEETSMLLAFIMRSWNVTPRKELGGKSPEEMAMKRNPPRRPKQPGKKRRK